MTPVHKTVHEGLEGSSGIDAQLVDVLARFPGVVLALVFGSVALGLSADLMPYCSRVLAERRAAWTGK